MIWESSMEDVRLFDAVSAGNVTRVGELIRDEGLDPNQVVYRFGRDYTILAWASSRLVPMVDGRRLPIVELLASEGANAAAGGPLVECTWVEVIEALISFGAIADQSVAMPDGRKLTPLVARCEELHEEAIAVLLKNSAAADVTLPDGTPLFFNICLKTLEPNADEDKVLRIAKLLLNAGANVDATNTKGNSPLSFAVTVYDRLTSRPQTAPMKLISFLLTANANVGHRELSDGSTVLINAVRNPAARVHPFNLMNTLFSFGADAYIDVYDIEGRTALHYLVSWENEVYNMYAETNQLIRLMLTRGCFVNPRDAEGETPLYRLVRYLCPPWGSVSPRPFPKPGTPLRQYTMEILRFLLANGADKTISNSRGDTCRMVAGRARDWGKDVLPFVS